MLRVAVSLDRLNDIPTLEATLGGKFLGAEILGSKAEVMILPTFAPRGRGRKEIQVTGCHLKRFAPGRWGWWGSRYRVRINTDYVCKSEGNDYEH